MLWSRGREQQDTASRRLGGEETRGEQLQRPFARRVEPVQILNPKHRELATPAGPDQIQK